MWNLFSRPRGHQQVPPFKNQSSLHTSTIPLVTGLSLNIIPDKKFSNPNYVNLKNPSVLGYYEKYHENDSPLNENISDSIKINVKNHGIVDDDSNIIKNSPQNTENSSGGAKENQNQEETENAYLEEGKPAKMCTAVRKRPRKARKKARDSARMPGKHCKNLDKEQKHSKHVENQQIIRELIMEVENEESNRSFSPNNSEEPPTHEIVFKFADFVKDLSTQLVERDHQLYKINEKMDEAEVKTNESDIKTNEFDCKTNETRHKRNKTRHQIEDIQTNEVLGYTIDSSDSDSDSSESDKDTEDSSEEEDYGVDEVDDGGYFAISLGPKILPPRFRQVSLTESEDSFIMFASGPEDECDFLEDSEEEDTEIEESENNDFDAETETDGDATSSSSVIPTKKVRFAEDKKLCKVYPMIKWAYAYQAARKGPWEECVRDRQRFQRRIMDIETIIGHVLKPDHRDKIYSERFVNVEVPMEV